MVTKKDATKIVDTNNGNNSGPRFDPCGTPSGVIMPERRSDTFLHSLTGQKLIRYENSL